LRSKVVFDVRVGDPGMQPTKVLQQRAGEEHYSHERADKLDLFILPPHPFPTTRARNLKISPTFCPLKPMAVCTTSLYVDIDQHRLSDTFDLRNDTFEIEGFSKNDLEDLLHIY